MGGGGAGDGENGGRLGGGGGSGDGDIGGGADGGCVWQMQSTVEPGTVLGMADETAALGDGWLRHSALMTPCLKASLEPSGTGVKDSSLINCPGVLTRAHKPIEPGDAVVRLVPAVPKTGTSDSQYSRVLLVEW